MMTQRTMPTFSLHYSTRAGINAKQVGISLVFIKRTSLYLRQVKDVVSSAWRWSRI